MIILWLYFIASGITGLEQYLYLFINKKNTDYEYRLLKYRLLK